ncbi:MAG: hypothetical protein IIC78_02375 [Chloroflexi bacterium]|nr:hypothetical protein [Chloroflexota bacterium]
MQPAPAKPTVLIRDLEKLTSRIPTDYLWVVFAKPVLIHLETYGIFAFGKGNYIYTFPVPMQFREAAFAEHASQEVRYAYGSGLDLAQKDVDSIFGGTLNNEGEKCLKAFQEA